MATVVYDEDRKRAFYDYCESYGVDASKLYLSAGANELGFDETRWLIVWNGEATGFAKGNCYWSVCLEAAKGRV